MSYQKALAFTAVGIGAFLQGCKDDGNTTENTDCATVKTYQDLKDGTAEVEKCSECIADQDVIKDYELPEGSKDIAFWAKALAEALANPTDEAKTALPVKALNACGAVRNAESCKTLGGISDENDPDALLDTIGDLSTAAGLSNCPLCIGIDLKDDPSCADIKTALKECGYPEANLNDIDCDADYRCNSVDDYKGIKEGSTADADCKTCLDEAVTDNTYDKVAVSNALDVVHADFLTLVGYWTTCGAQPTGSSCATAFGTDDVTLTRLLTAVKGDNTQSADEQFQCGVCLAVQKPESCSDVKAAIQNCDGTTDLSTGVVCDSCADFDNSDCNSCMSAALGSAWNPPATASTTSATDFVSGWAPAAYCGAAFESKEAGQKTACNGETGVTATAADDIGAEVAGLNNACEYCVFTFIAQQEAGVRSCDTYSKALLACSETGTNAATPPTCPSS